ncbi:MAG: ATP synthase F1 subunit epsilon [Blastopirellula sp. JB062]
MAQLKCIVVTPEETALETTAEFVALPLFDGEIGIAPSHSPMIGRLGYGEMRIVSGGKTTRYYVDGGFVQVANDEVNVLTGKALPAESVSKADAEEQLQNAMRQPASTDELLAIRDRMVAQARAQIRVSQN